MTTPKARLRADGLSLAYNDRQVVHALDLAVPPQRITVVVGPNACGKSTLLRGLARMLGPTGGRVLLDGKDIHRSPTKQVAKVMGLLPQSPTAPEGISVADLASRGRYPHQGWCRRWTADDDAAVTDAMRSTRTLDLAGRSVDELSGGQRQRVWIAMALAQQTEVLLLDEPTTYLDVTHQIDVLDLLFDLRRSRCTTVVLVLHDLNLACRYADHLVVMSQGRIADQGTPGDVVDTDLVRDVFGLEAVVVPDPVSGTPMVIPIGRHHQSRLGAEPAVTREAV